MSGWLLGWSDMLCRSRRPSVRVCQPHHWWFQPLLPQQGPAQLPPVCHLQNVWRFTIDLCYGNIPKGYKSRPMPSLGRSVHSLIHLLPLYHQKLKSSKPISWQTKWSMPFWNTWRSQRPLPRCFSWTSHQHSTQSSLTCRCRSWWTWTSTPWSSAASAASWQTGHNVLWSGHQLPWRCHQRSTPTLGPLRCSHCTHLTAGVLPKLQLSQPYFSVFFVVPFSTQGVTVVVGVGQKMFCYYPALRGF